MNQLTATWEHLNESPLLWLTATLLAYQLASWLSQRLRNHPLLNPVLTAMLLLAGLLWAVNVPYTTYFEGARFIHFLLGPATVALAIPLYLQFRRVREMAMLIVFGLLAGSLAAIVSAMLLAHWLGASPATVISMAPKSVTTPIAMGIAERLGGIPSLTAVVVILTGIFGAVIGPPLFRLCRVRDQAIRGFSMGLAAHGVGTARAFTCSEQAGAFSALAMGLNGLLTAVLVPVLLPLFGTWLN